MATCIHAFYNAPIFLLIVAVFILQGNTCYISQKKKFSLLIPLMYSVQDFLMWQTRFWVICASIFFIFLEFLKPNIWPHKLSYTPERLLCATLVHQCSVSVVTTTTSLCGHGRLKGGYLLSIVRLCFSHHASSYHTKHHAAFPTANSQTLDTSPWSSQIW